MAQENGSRGKFRLPGGRRSCRRFVWRAKFARGPSTGIDRPRLPFFFFFFLFFLFALRTRRGTNALAGKRREREMESGLLNRIIPGRETVANRIRGSKRGPYCIQFGHCC